MKATKHTLVGPLGLSPGRRWAITAGVMTGMFLAALEATVVGTAMPTVIASLGGLEHYSWVFSAYLLTSTVTVPVWGKLSDLYGRRPLFQAGVAIFVIGSVLSGMSNSMMQLILFRALQGLGAGALVPLAMTIIGDIYTLEERARMQALFSGVWGLSSVVGPIVGGFLTDQLSWRWVFYLNVPFGIASALIMGFALKEPHREQRPVVDYTGAALLMFAVVLLMLALVNEGSALFGLRNLLLMSGSAILTSFFVFYERRVKDPIVPFQLFQNRVVAVAVIAGFLTGIAMFGAISFIPLFAQGTRGATATEAGSLLTPLMLSWVSLSIVGGRLLIRIGYRPTVLAGCVLLTFGFIILSEIPRNAGSIWLYADLVVIGAGLGLTMLTLLIAVQQAVPRNMLGTATSLNQFSRSIGGAVGVAIMGAVLSAGLAARLQLTTGAKTMAINPNALMDPLARAAMSPATLQRLETALYDSLRSVFLLATIVSAVSFVVALALPRAVKQDSKTTPSKEACEMKNAERLMIAEMATIDADHEPAAGD
jgi:drug resistance transporter, EmrB/QacA subfamily